MPLAIVSANTNAVWQLVWPVSCKLELPNHEPLSADYQSMFLHKTVADLCCFACRSEMEEFLREQDCLSAEPPFPGRALGQPFKEPRVCLHEAVPPITQDLRRHLEQPWRQLVVLELAVLLVNRALHAGQGKGMGTERAEVAVFLHLRVVYKPLAADPAI